MLAQPRGPPFLPSSIQTHPPGVQFAYRRFTLPPVDVQAIRLTIYDGEPQGMEAVNLLERRPDPMGVGPEQWFYTTYRRGNPPGTTHLSPTDPALPYVTCMHDVHIALAPIRSHSTSMLMQGFHAPGPGRSGGNP